MIFAMTMVAIIRMLQLPMIFLFINATIQVREAQGCNARQLETHEQLSGHVQMLQVHMCCAFGFEPCASACLSPPWVLYHDNSS